jgi:hypothetical protein
MAAVAMALLSCTAPPRQVNGTAISFGIAGFDDVEATLGSVLAPAEAYVLPPLSSVIPRQTRKSYSDRSYARSKTTSRVDAYGPRPGAKRSTPVKIRTDNVEQELVAKFKAAQAKATKVGVENLTKEDIDGLSSAQLKELRGY